jgi:hypothetical protein
MIIDMPKSIKLNFWTYICKKNNVPIIESIFGDTMFTVGDFKNMLDNPQESNIMNVAIEEIRRFKMKILSDYIVRTNIFSFPDIKIDSQTGQLGKNIDMYKYITFDFPRYFELPNNFIDCFVIRPYVEPMRIDETNFSAEFRAFVKNKKLWGISFYYPQCQIFNPTQIEKYIEPIKYYTETIINDNESPISFTLDFFVDVKSDIFVIEGNPYDGSHKCCFEKDFDTPFFKYNIAKYEDRNEKAFMTLKQNELDQIFEDFDSEFDKIIKKEWKGEKNE